MTEKKRKPLFVDKYLEGLEPEARAKKIGHRGILRNYQFANQSTPLTLPEFLKFMRDIHPDYTTPHPYIGRYEPDGFFYTYIDEWVSQADSIQQASTILNRNRSTLNGYMKNDDFPAEKRNDDGSCCLLYTSDAADE